MSCKFAGRNEPRVLSGRHLINCAGDCDGCQPCELGHCRVCNLAHHEQTCAECMATARVELHSIASRCDALPAEVKHRGIQGEAMTLLGPAADPEAWGHVEASVLSGRIAPEWIEAGGGELHPKTILLTWQMVARDALEHDEAPDAELATAVEYLDRNLTYLGGYEHLPFEDMARDFRKCLAHLEAVLHDQPQGDRANVGCFDCGRDLERRLGKEGFDDFWTCQGCKRRYTYAEYNFALRAHLEAALSEQEVAS